MNIGGIESFIMNSIRADTSNCNEVTILTYRDQHFDYEAELVSRGVKILRVSDPTNISMARHLSELVRTMRAAKVDVVHAHTYFDSAFVLLAAMLAGVPTRITHSHTALAASEKRFYKRVKWVLARFLFRIVASRKIACSNEAGYALFGKQPFVVVPNGIDLHKFQYSLQDRELLRRELGIEEGAFVVGHVGRFDIPKNHLFLIEVFQIISAKYPHARLILVGSGKLEHQIRAKVEECGIVDKVLLLGDRNDVSRLLNVFDYFVFPSIYEGLPVSLIEVQANGLPALVSNAVSPEVKVSECVEFLPLSAGAKVWADSIMVKTSRIDTSKSKYLQAYDIRTTVKELQTIYENIS
jgi:glycosyltransferase involved in cell wall biosynthesis